MVSVDGLRAWPIDRYSDKDVGENEGKTHGKGLSIHTDQTMETTLPMHLLRGLHVTLQRVVMQLSCSVVWFFEECLRLFTQHALLDRDCSHSQSIRLAESEQSMDVFTISDKNNDGVITRSELVAAFGAPPKSFPAPAPKKNGPFPKP